MGVAQIGPNALTQLFAPIERRVGPEGLSRLLDAARAPHDPDMSGLIDEAPVVRMHTRVIRDLADEAEAIEREAGMATAEYILAHRIPRVAKMVLRALPAPLARFALSKAIAKNAWTFAGSGSFRIASQRPLVFEITGNPLARELQSAHPLCAWHCAVFQTLFRRLADPGAEVIETACCAMGNDACRFTILRG